MGICACCQFWEGDCKNEPFTVDTKTNTGKCVVDFSNGPKKLGQTPACKKITKWDKLK